MATQDTVSIVLPVYNERSSIELVLQEWQSELTRLKVSYRFVVCEDGSRDGTSKFLREIKRKYRLTLDQKRTRRGYGGAVIDGISLAKSKYILCIDSDGQCDPKDFAKFWQRRHKADVLIGWRKDRSDALQRKLFSQLFKSVFMFLFPTTIHDPSAPFVLFEKSKITPYLHYLKFLSEGFWWGFIGMCVKKNLSISELSMNHRPRLFGDTQVYHIKKIPSIARRNLLGLVQLRKAP
jgi:dolichol-phosphate mannosyltransferase